jgi:hypothetical protein
MAAARSLPMQSAWAAWRFTGQDKYLRPVLGRLVPGNFSALGELNENALTVLGQREAWAAATRKAAQGGNDVARFEHGTAPATRPGWPHSTPRALPTRRSTCS